jgi:hypothetical protein
VHSYGGMILLARMSSTLCLFTCCVHIGLDHPPLILIPTFQQWPQRTTFNCRQPSHWQGPHISFQKRPKPHGCFMVTQPTVVGKLACNHLYKGILSITEDPLNLSLSNSCSRSDLC